MKKNYFLFLAFNFLLGYCLYAQDVKVKLNSTDGSTSFQVRDLNDVVVSSITSDGSVITRYGVKAATGNFTATGANTYSVVASSGIKMNAGVLEIGPSPARVIFDDSTNYTTNFSSHVSILGNLLVNGVFAGKIVSTATYSSAWSNATVDGAYEDIPGVSVTFTMPTAGVVFGFFTCNYKDADGGFINYELMLDNTTEFGIAGDDSDTAKVKSITAIGMVSAGAGSHTVKVRRKGDATTTNKLGSQYHSLVVFAWSTP